MRRVPSALVTAFGSLFHHPILLSSCFSYRPIVLSSYRPIILSSYHPIVLSSYRPIILSSYLS